MTNWKNNRPDDWDKGECEGCNRRIDDEFGEFFCDISCGAHSAQVNYEAGADAILKAIWKLAKDSPTGTFTFDANTINIFREAE